MKILMEVLHTKYALTEKEVVAIEKAINKAGVSEAVVKVEKGEVVILQVEKRKAN